jgi:Asp/Glu/hydantoin racemase
MMTEKISGGRTTYGHIVGILMTDSQSPRIPGDPGHAETFSFPVIYEVLKGFPFDDLITIKKGHMDILLNRAKALEDKGVSLIVADCGLFGPFQEDMKKHLHVPFIGSALDMVPFLNRFLPPDRKVGIITGDTRLLKPAHFEASGIDLETICIAGMDNSSEFKKVVIDRSPELNIEKMRQGVVDAALTLSSNHLGAVVLECTNLISFRAEVQKALKVPVFDLVSLIEFYVSGLRLAPFHTTFI